MLLVIPLEDNASATHFDVLAFDVLRKAAVPGQERAGHKYITRKADGKGGWQYAYAAPQGAPRRLGVGSAVTTRTGAAGMLHKIEHSGKTSTFHVKSRGQKHEFRFDGKKWAGRKAGGKWGKLARTPLHVPARSKAKKLTPKQKLEQQKKQHSEKLLAHQKAFAKKLKLTVRGHSKKLEQQKKISAGALLSHQKAFAQKLQAHKRTASGRLAESKKRNAKQVQAHAVTQRNLIVAHKQTQAQLKGLRDQLGQQHAQHQASTQTLVREHKVAQGALVQAQRSGDRRAAQAATAQLREHAGAQAKVHAQLLAEHSKSTRREGQLQAQLAQQGAQLSQHAKLLASLQGNGKAKAAGKKGKGKRAEGGSAAPLPPSASRSADAPPPLPERAAPPTRAAGVPPPLPGQAGQPARATGTPPPLPARAEGQPAARATGQPPPLPARDSASATGPVVATHGQHTVQRGSNGLWQVRRGSKVIAETGSRGAAIAHAAHRHSVES